MKKTNRAFSLIELSIVILIIGVLIAATGQGIELLSDAKLSAARQITQSSRVSSIKGLVLWYESALESSFLANELSDGAAVSIWNDNNTQTGSKNNAIQPTVVNRPIYTSSAINGLPALKFNGAQTMAAIDPAVLPSTSTGATVFGIALSTSTATNQPQDFIRMDPGVVLGATTAGASTTTRCSRWFYATTGWVGTWATPGAPDIAFKNPMMCSARYDGATVQGWTNGSKADDSQTASGFVPTSALTRIAGSYTGYIGEIIVFNRALSAKEMDAVEAYLSKKWNIKID